MATTYTLISSNVLTGSAASVTFSSIPSTYTDLVLRCSTRVDGATAASNGGFYFNGTQGTSYSFTALRGNGSGGSSSRLSSGAYIRPSVSAGTTATSNTFSSWEIYIPNYTGTTQKPTGGFGVGENDASAATMDAVAGLANITSAITSITFYDVGFGYNFVSGSSFYLYGIKNS